MRRSPDQVGASAVSAIAAIADPFERARVAANVAGELDRVRREALDTERRATSFSAVAGRLGVSKQRVEQIIAANTPLGRSFVAYAFRDQAGQIHGRWDALPDGEYAVGSLAFNPSSPSPFAGQQLEVRFTDQRDAVGAVYVYTLHLRVPDRDSTLVVRDTVELHDLLYPGHG